ncbi:DUF6174 domain-containing protein [uncultured Thiothrix sp.]|uniref:DUF6174 domain-containing protein n=1 Tax=uncultured Thiothrix sp. TaxID=223185 RepID=UPI0026258C3C|nr:DUF6174 domain-containing protein [uncultured Thiothrix sp.]
MINNDYSRSLTTSSAFQTSPVATDATTKNQSNLFLNNGLSDSKEVTNGIMSLVQQLLGMLQKGGGHKPDRTPTLNLTSEQEAGLKNLLGFSNEAVSVKVLDRQRDKALSAGDVVVVSGGITGGEITRHTLTQKDIDQLNGKTTLPQDFLDSRAKWDAATSNAQSVSYTAQNSCFCPPDYTRPMNITEQNGKIIDATYADTGEVVPSYIRDGLLTMNERFDQLEQAYLSGADRIDVSYDPRLGYPSSVYVDQSFMIADEELSYTIKDLAVSAK